MTVNEDMTGLIHVPEDDTTITVMNLLLEGQTVTFEIVFDLQGQEIAAKFNGTLDGDDISGVFVTDIGNATVTGKRAE